MNFRNNHNFGTHTTIFYVIMSPWNFENYLLNLIHTVTLKQPLNSNPRRKSSYNYFPEKLRANHSGLFGWKEKKGKHMSRSGKWLKVRRLAWDRDRKVKAPCHICNQAIDYTLAPSSYPNSWEPDHVIPVSIRPDLELDLANIKASHMRCNRVRGDGTNGENIIGMQSRIW